LQYWRKNSSLQQQQQQQQQQRRQRQQQQQQRRQRQQLDKPTSSRQVLTAMTIMTNNITQPSHLINVFAQLQLAGCCFQKCSRPIPNVPCTPHWVACNAYSLSD
jgi:hypothetical protein